MPDSVKSKAGLRPPRFAFSRKEPFQICRHAWTASKISAIWFNVAPYCQMPGCVRFRPLPVPVKRLPAVRTCGDGSLFVVYRKNFRHRQRRRSFLTVKLTATASGRLFANGFRACPARQKPTQRCVGCLVEKPGSDFGQEKLPCS